MFNIKIKKTSLIVANKEPLASGASKIYHVSFDFDEEWDELLKNVIFKAGETSVAVLLEGNSCQIPWEVLSSENIGEKLWIGVYGSDTEGTKLPTIWNELEVIQAGAELCGSGSEPTPTAVSLIYDVAKNAEKTAKDAIDEASKTGLYSDMAEKSKEAAEAAAKEAKSTLASARVEVRLAWDEAERAKEQANLAAESAEIAKSNTADIKKQCANALRGKLSGAIVRVDDVSPIEHELDIKLTGENVGGTKVIRLGKNFANLAGLPETKKYKAVTNTTSGYRIDDDGNIIITTSSTDKSGYTYVGTNIKLSELCPEARVEMTMRLRAIDSYSEGASKGNVVIYLPQAGVSWAFSETAKAITITQNMLDSNVVIYASPTLNAVRTISNFQIELGENATEYEPYIEPAEAVADAEGNVSGLMSLAPSMTLITDNESAVIECAYNRDTNKVIEELTNAIISLGGNI